MASIKKYETAKGRAWRVQYRSPDGKSRTKQGFRTKTAAQAWADKNATDVRDGTWCDPTLARRTVADYAPLFFKTKAHLAPGSLRPMRSSWENWVKPVWGARTVGSIRKPEVQAWLSEHHEKPVSVRRAHGVLAGILDIAVDDGAVPLNRARGVTLPKKPIPKKIYLTEGQLVGLAKECGANGGIVLTLGMTGLRWGELAGLQVSDIPDIGCRVKVARAVTWEGQELHVGLPKNGEPRVIAVPETVMGFFRSQAQGRAPGEWLFGGESPLKPLGHHSWFAFAVRRCVEAGVIPERITPHGLRHVAAGLMIGSGATVKVVQRYLGHKNAAETLQTYADLWENDVDAIGSVMDSRFSNVVELSCDGVVEGLKKTS